MEREQSKKYMKKLLAPLRKILYLYHRRMCVNALHEASMWWFYFDTDYYRFHHAIAMKHARKMRAMKA